MDMGPVNYVVVTFESTPVPTSGLDALTSLVDGGRIVVLDAEFVRKADDGSLAKITASEAGVESFEGASSGLIDDDDVAMVGEQLAPGNVGLVVIYEDLTLLPVLQAWTGEGATIAVEGPILIDDLVETLDATEN